MSGISTPLPVSVKHLCGKMCKWLTGSVLFSVSSVSLHVLAAAADEGDEMNAQKSYDRDYYYVRCRIICRNPYWEFSWKDICLSPSLLSFHVTRCSLPGKFKLPARCRWWLWSEVGGRKIKWFIFGNRKRTDTWKYRVLVRAREAPVFSVFSGALSTPTHNIPRNSSLIGNCEFEESSRKRKELCRFYCVFFRNTRKRFLLA